MAIVEVSAVTTKIILGTVGITSIGLLTACGGASNNVNTTPVSLDLNCFVGGTPRSASATLPLSRGGSRTMNDLTISNTDGARLNINPHNMQSTTVLGSEKEVASTTVVQNGITNTVLINAVDASGTITFTYAAVCPPESAPGSAAEWGSKIGK